MRKELLRIVEGREVSAVVDIFTRPYLERVFGGVYPIPDMNGYYMAVDGPGRVTPLSDALEIGNVYTTTPLGVRRAIERNEAAGLKALGIDPEGDAFIAAVSAKEGRILGAAAVVEEPKGPRATRTLRNGSGHHVVLRRNGIGEEPDRGSRTPSRLVVVFKAQEPEQYLPKRG